MKSFLPQTAVAWAKENVREKSPDQTRPGWRVDPGIQATMSSIEEVGMQGAHAEGPDGGQVFLEGVLKLAAEADPTEGAPGILIEDWRSQVGGVLDGSSPAFQGSAATLRVPAELAACEGDVHCSANITAHIEKIREIGRQAAADVEGPIASHAAKVLASPETTDLLYALIGKASSTAISALPFSPVGKILAKAGAAKLNASFAGPKRVARGLVGDAAVAAFFRNYAESWTEALYGMHLLANATPEQSEPALREMAENTGALLTDLQGGIWGSFLGAATAMPETVRFDGMPKGGYHFKAEFDFNGGGITKVRIPSVVPIEHHDAVQDQADLFSTQGWLIHGEGFLGRADPDGSVEVFRLDPGFSHEVLSTEGAEMTEVERMERLSSMLAEQWGRDVSKYSGMVLGMTGLEVE